MMSLTSGYRIILISSLGITFLSENTGSMVPVYALMSSSGTCVYKNKSKKKSSVVKVNDRLHCSIFDTFLEEKKYFFLACLI